MLKLGNMDGERVERRGALAAHVVEHALAASNDARHWPSAGLLQAWLR